MSSLDSLINKLLGTIGNKIAEIEAFRAIVVSTSNGKVQIAKIEAGGTPHNELYARVLGFSVAPGDEVLVMPVGSARKYVIVGKLQRSTPTGLSVDAPFTTIDINGGTIDTVTITDATINNPDIDGADISSLRTVGTSPTITKLTAGGSTGTVSIPGGNDIAGICQITPSGTGIAAGAVFTINFATAKANGNYAVLLTPGSSAARTYGNHLGASSRSSTKVEISVATALTSGSNYQWHYLIIPY